MFVLAGARARRHGLRPAPSRSDTGQPGGLAAERLLGLGRQRGLVLGEEDPVADIHRKVLLGARHGLARAGLEVGVLFFEQAESARRQQKAAAILKLTDVVMS